MEGMVVRRLARPDQPFFTHDEIKNAKSLVETLKSDATPSDAKSQSSLASAP